jgi:hypothetical protein
MGLQPMAMAKQDINDFNARVKRINNPRNNSYYDPDLKMHVPKRVTRDKIKTAKTEDSIMGALIVSMIVGALGVLFAQVIRIRYFELSGANDVILFLELFLAFWAVITLSAMMRRRKVTERIAQIAGVALMMVAGHNLIWRWPDQMAIIYTPAHVEEVMQVTTQHSVVYRGTVYGL